MPAARSSTRSPACGSDRGQDRLDASGGPARARARRWSRRTARRPRRTSPRPRAAACPGWLGSSAQPSMLGRCGAASVLGSGVRCDRDDRPAADPSTERRSRSSSARSSSTTPARWSPAARARRRCRGCTAATASSPGARRLGSPRPARSASHDADALVARAVASTASSATRRTLPGSGLVAFGSFAYADEPGDSVLVVPEVVVGRRGDCRLGHHDQRADRCRPAPQALTSRRDASAAGRDLQRRRDERRRVGARRRRRRRADPTRRPRQGRPRARPRRRARRAARRPRPARAARRPIPGVLDVPRRRPVRRDAGDAGPPRARPGDQPGPRRDHPPHRRRRARPGAGGDPGALVEGPRGARVRRALGRRRAGAVLPEHERPREPVRAAPAQRHAPRDRRHRCARRRDHLARARRGPAPERGRRRNARPATRSR